MAALSKGFSVQGIDPFLEKLKPLGAKVQARVAKQAVGAAAAQIRMLAKKLVKSNRLGEGLTPDGRKRPHLHETIKSFAKSYGPDRIPVGIVGTNYLSTPHDHLVHEGTAPHVTPVPAPGLAGRLGRKFNVPHPGAKPYPFMRIAQRLGQDKAQAAMVTKVQKAIEKELTKNATAK